MFALAECWVKQKKYLKAILLYEELILKQTSIYGENHEQTLTSMHQLAYCWTELKDYSKAVSMLEKVVKKTNSDFG